MIFEHAIFIDNEIDKKKLTRTEVCPVRAADPEKIGQPMDGDRRDEKSEFRACPWRSPFPWTNFAGGSGNCHVKMGQFAL